MMAPSLLLLPLPLLLLLPSAVLASPLAHRAADAGRADASLYTAVSIPLRRRTAVDETALQTRRLTGGGQLQLRLLRQRRADRQGPLAPGEQRRQSGARLVPRRPARRTRPERRLPRRPRRLPRRRLLRGRRQTLAAAQALHHLQVRRPLQGQRRRLPAGAARRAATLRPRGPTTRRPGRRTGRLRLRRRPAPSRERAPS